MVLILLTAFLVLAVCKLIGVMNVSWWVVFAPLWIPLVLWLAIVGVGAALVGAV